MDNTFSVRTKELMKSKRVTQTELAEAIQITQATLSRNLSGVHRPKAEVVEKIASFFNVSSDYLLGYSDVRSQQTPPTDLQFALHGYENSLSDDDKEMILSLAKKLANKNDTK